MRSFAFGNIFSNRIISLARTDNSNLTSNFGSCPSHQLILFAPRSFLRMGYCYHSTHPYVRTHVRPRMLSILNDIYVFLGIITSVVLEDFFTFCDNYFFGWPRHFLNIFQCKRTYSGRAASQVIYAGMFSLHILYLLSGTPGPFFVFFF